MIQVKIKLAIDRKSVLTGFITDTPSFGHAEKLAAIIWEGYTYTIVSMNSISVYDHIPLNKDIIEESEIQPDWFRVQCYYTEENGKGGVKKFTHIIYVQTFAPEYVTKIINEKYKNFIEYTIDAIDRTIIDQIIINDKYEKK